MSERIRKFRGSYDDALYKSTYTLLYFVVNLLLVVNYYYCSIFFYWNLAVFITCCWNIKLTYLLTGRFFQQMSQQWLYVLLKIKKRTKCRDLFPKRVQKVLHLATLYYIFPKNPSKIFCLSHLGPWWLQKQNSALWRWCAEKVRLMRSSAYDACFHWRSRSTRQRCRVTATLSAASSMSPARHTAASVGVRLVRPADAAMNATYDTMHSPTKDAPVSPIIIIIIIIIVMVILIIIKLQRCRESSSFILGILDLCGVVIMAHWRIIRPKRTDNYTGIGIVGFNVPLDTL